MTTHDTVLRILPWLCAALAAAAGGTGHAADAAPLIAVTGSGNLRLGWTDRKSTSLNPDGALLDEEQYRHRAYGMVELEAGKAPLVRAQFRPIVELKSTDDQPRARLEVDEVYLEVPINGRLFLYGGRRQVVHGVALGENPVDFFDRGREEDRSLDVDQRRKEKNGDDLIGIDYFIEDVFFSAVYAPRLQGLQEADDRALVTVSSFIAPWKSDISLFGYYGDHPAPGLSASLTVTDQLVVYGESAMFFERDRRTVSPIGPVALGAFSVSTEDDTGFYPDTVVGASYTFESATVNLEYRHNRNGYSDTEWKIVRDLIEINVDNFRRGIAVPLARGNLLRLNGVLDREFLRQNYLFLRVSYPNLLPRSDAELTHTQNLDDYSAVIGLRLDYELTDALLVGAHGEIFTGDADSEFGLRTPQTTATLYARYRF